MKSIWRDVTATFRLTATEKANIEYCAAHLCMTQTEVVVQGVELVKEIIDKRRQSGRKPVEKEPMK